MQPESIKIHLTPAQVGGIVAGNRIVLPEGPICIEIVMARLEIKDPDRMECPYLPGTEDYHLWWEAYHQIQIGKMRQKSLESTVGNGHDFDKATRKCRKCGIGEIYALGRPNACRAQKCMKHIPAGYAPCTRPHGHDGPCAQPLKMPDCNLCGKPLAPGERENHQECMALENQ